MAPHRKGLTIAEQPPDEGWYDNPEGEGERYWDGNQWTDQYRGTDPSPPKDEGEKKAWWKRWWGIAGIVLFAIIVIASLTGDDASDLEQAVDEPAAEQETSEPDAREVSEEVTEPAATELEEEVVEEPPPPAFSEPITASGSGDDIVPLEIPENSPGAITFTHEGSQNFAVWSVDSQGNQMNLLVNAIGAYQGTRPINFDIGQDVAELEITASGPWTLEAKPLSLTTELNASGESSGNGDDVVRVPDGLQGSAVTLSHQGDQNFAIWAYGDTASLLVNEIGSYNGTVRMPGGAVVLDITASGPWTIAPR